jgi:cation:H+ antiporter
MTSHLLILLASLGILAKSADWLVDYGARIARRFSVSDLVIGLTLTSIGTSIPELASSISASVQGNAGLAMGNVIGSNIANVGLIVATAAIVHPFETEKKMYDRDGFILHAAAVLLFAVCLDNRFGRFEAGIFLSIYLAYVGFVATSDKDRVSHQFRFFLNYFIKLDYVRPLVGKLRGRSKSDSRPQETNPAEKRGVVIELMVIVGSCAGVVLGARYMVREATWLATKLGVPDSVIGLSIVAVGTSLPELMVAIAAARKGNASMVIGNVMGSNLANILLILGVTGSISPIEVAEIDVVYTMPIMLFFGLGLLYIVKSGWLVTRFQGALTLAAYVAFLAIAFIPGL